MCLKPWEFIAAIAAGVSLLPDARYGLAVGGGSDAVSLMHCYCLALVAKSSVTLEWFYPI